ncbi:MAG: CDP-diacylglycerol--glycerol-3-phosphate 3-phosphatidyltransferase [Caldicoprobacterales bacterium]|jgi:cardiolipin synthase|nr:CDP-diacylglycerol--glycerol-3-phosphate 3-phosphatidyltransferase [Clostridiales bacterium]
MNIPNILTTIRFCLVGVFIYVFNNPAIENNLKWGIIIFVVAGITDVLDGYIARKYDMITKWGKLMDPLADKLMLIVVLISLYTVNIVPLIVIIIVLAKELLMVLGAIFLYKNRQTVVQSNIVGKAASAAFYVAIIALVFELPYAYYMLGIAVFLTLFALVQYGIINLGNHNTNA